MKQKLLWILFCVVTALNAATLETVSAYPPVIKPDAQEAKAAHLAASLLSRYHYKALPLDDALSGKMFDQYLKTLDPEKLNFLQADIDRLQPSRNQLDDAILNEDLSAPFEIFALYQRRAAQNLAFARGLLKSGFDFQGNETYQIDRKNQPWPATEVQMQELWRKRVKNDWLRLKLAGTDQPSIVKILDKRYEAPVKRLARLKSADVFDLFMNAYTMAIEPHTNYMGPRAAEDFGISMRLSLVGIGAVLTDLDEYTTIRELVPGGPASLSGLLKVGDRIVGVAQGQSGAMEDVLGQRLDDTVALIRGKVDSTVRLDVLPAEAGPDGPHKTVSLVRKTITMQDQAAKAKVYSVVDGKDTRRVGVISLPSFYEDFDARQRGLADYKSASRDVASLLARLKQQNVSSVLIDLRNNGGGSLGEAVQLTGLFVGKQPVVQERNAGGDINVEVNTRVRQAWDGPMGVLINRASASASEIFAAAIQDYGRGLILGEPSFGKGTVQTMASLDQLAKNAKPKYGEVKMTIAQFFRVNGGTTQLRGVTPDIALPGFIDPADYGESSFDNALAWTQIKPADYLPLGDLKAQLPLLAALHEQRIRHDSDFQNLLDDLAQARALRKKNVLSLNEADRRKDRDSQEKRLAARSKAAGPALDAALQDDGLQADERKLSSELSAEKALKSAKDVLLNEALSILGDAAALKKNSAQPEARVSSASPVLVMELAPRN